MQPDNLFACSTANAYEIPHQKSGVECGELPTLNTLRKDQLKNLPRLCNDRLKISLSSDLVQSVRSASCFQHMFSKFFLINRILMKYPQEHKLLSLRRSLVLIHLQIEFGIIS